jgi:hypothetical protein
VEVGIPERDAMIPAFTDEGFLPKGIHTATRKEFEERFVVFKGSD